MRTNIQQAHEAADVTSPPLWPHLRVDSEAPISTILLNWAACLLPRPNQWILLSFASLLRLPYVGRNPKKELLGDSDPSQENVFPSWYPLPWLATSRLTSPFVNAGGCLFSACTSLTSRPRIYADGASLHLEAGIVDVLDHQIATVPTSLSNEMLGHFMLFAEEKSDGSDEPTEKTLPGICLTMLQTRNEKHGTLESICDFLTEDMWVSAHDDGVGSLRLTPRQGEIRFCHILDSLVFEAVDTLCQPEITTGNMFRYIVRNIKPTDEQKSVKTQIESEYQKLKAPTPTAPWPGTDACDVTKEEARRLRDCFGKAYRAAIKGRSVFATKEGRSTLATCWAAERDVVNTYPTSWNPPRVLKFLLRSDNTTGNARQGCSIALRLYPN